MVTLISLTCDYCQNIFNREQRQMHKKHKKAFCSKNCTRLSTITLVTKKCGSCTNIVKRVKSEADFSKSGNIFCSKSCSAIYGNAHKTTGTRVSKLELYLQQELTNNFSNINFIFNNKKEIGYELDIFIPKLNLAFEINGIFHYKPIYNKEKFIKTQIIDKQKLILCKERNINLIVVDTSNAGNFTLKYANLCYQHISNIIIECLSDTKLQNLAPGVEFESTIN